MGCLHSRSSGREAGDAHTNLTANLDTASPSLQSRENIPSGASASKSRFPSQDQDQETSARRLYETVREATSPELRTLYQRSEGLGSEDDFDVIFIHGLQWSAWETAWQDTWMTRGESRECWPQTWLVKSFGDRLYRVLSLSYDSSARASCSIKCSFEERATSLGQSLIDFRQIGERPFILVGHSLGGLVIKQMICGFYDQVLQKSQRSQREAAFLSQLRGIAFYDVPHNGAKDAVSLFYVNKLLRLGCTPLVTTTLQYRGPYVQQLAAKFEKFMEAKDADLSILAVLADKTTALFRVSPAFIPCNATRYSCYGADHDDLHTMQPLMQEAQSLTVRSTIVENDDARKHSTRSVRTRGCDHNDVCRPSSEGDVQYSHLLVFIEECTRRSSQAAETFRAAIGIQQSASSGLSSPAGHAGQTCSTPFLASNCNSQLHMPESPFSDGSPSLRLRAQSAYLRDAIPGAQPNAQTEFTSLDIGPLGSPYASFITQGRMSLASASEGSVKAKHDLERLLSSPASEESESDPARFNATSGLVFPFIVDVEAELVAKDQRFRQVFVESFQELDRQLGAAVRPSQVLEVAFNHSCQEVGAEFLAVYNESSHDLLGFVAYTYMATIGGFYVSQLVIKKGFWRHGLGSRLLVKLWMRKPSRALYGLVRKNNWISKRFCGSLQAISWNDTDQWPKEYLEIFGRESYIGFKITPEAFQIFHSTNT